MKQKGFVLIVSLIFVVIMTLLALAMFSGLSTDETMSGNHREKSRSRDAAQAALNTAENWLLQPGNAYNVNWVGNSSGSGSAIACAGVVAASPFICSYSLTDPSNVGASGISLADPTTWTAYATPTIAGVTVSTTGGANNYAGNAGGKNSQIYIQFLGLDDSTNPPSGLYQVTAAALGGNATATTVVQSVYEIQCLSCCVSC
jgi:type IV pilus assembly protein PilX